MKTISVSGKYGDGKSIIIDDDDYELVCKWKWHVDKRGYAVRNVWVNKDGHKTCITIQMHSLINNTPKGKQTDHINRNRLDNRKKNLRTVSPRENSINSGKRSKLNKYKGVRQTPSGNFTVLVTTKEKQRKYFGTYKSETVAARVYDYIIYNEFGNLSGLNFPKQTPTNYYHPDNHRIKRYEKNN